MGRRRLPSRSPRSRFARSGARRRSGPCTSRAVRARPTPHRRWRDRTSSRGRRPRRPPMRCRRAPRGGAGPARPPARSRRAACRETTLRRCRARGREAGAGRCRPTRARPRRGRLRQRRCRRRTPRQLPADRRWRAWRPGSCGPHVLACPTEPLIVRPPSTRSSWPVMYRDASEARKTAASPISDGSAM